MCKDRVRLPRSPGPAVWAAFLLAIAYGSFAQLAGAQPAVAPDLAREIEQLREQQAAADQERAALRAEVRAIADAASAVARLEGHLNRELDAIWEHIAKEGLARDAALASLNAEAQELEQVVRVQFAAVQAELKSMAGALDQSAAQPTPAADAGGATLVSEPAVRSPPTAEVRAPVAVLEDVSRHVSNLERATMLALRTLDAQVESLSGTIRELEEVDKAFAAGFEQTRIALQSELVEWRNRHEAPVWQVASKLAGTEVRFAEGDEVADPSGTEETLRTVMETILGAAPEVGLRVVGYTDADGTDAASNLQMSEKRAELVRNELISLGVPKDRLVAVGRSTEARVDPSTERGNANRRVVFEPFMLPSPPS